MWNGQLVTAGGGIDRFVVGDGFQLEILTSAAQGSLLPHHGGDAIGSLAFRPLLLAGLLPVLETVQPLFQLLPGLFLQCVTQYPPSAGLVKCILHAFFTPGRHKRIPARMS